MQYRLLGAALMLAVSMPATAGEISLEQRVERLEAEAAIRGLQVEYSDRQDARDFDGYVDLFTEDGVWQNGTIVHQGRDAIKGLLVGLYGATPEGYANLDSYHIVSNPQIDVAEDGEHATGRSRHLLVMRDDKGSPVPMLAGVYEDEYVKVDGVWKISKRIDKPLMPQPQEWMAIIRERNARMKDAD